ncbi:MAG: thiol:disulfide interchange protein [Verrucomicrobiales bacterium]|jgi:thiol:disulfide interchange protein
MANSPLNSFYLGAALLIAVLTTTTNAQFGFGAPSKATETSVTDVQSIQPGVPFFAGVRLEIAPGWHTYWKNVGNDVGIPTSIEWELPEGFVAGELLFPSPHYEVTQDSPSHVFSGTVYHVSQITPPADLEPGTTVEIKATLKLLVCDATSCEPPNDRKLTFKLPVEVEAPKPSAEAPAISGMLDDSQLRLPNWPAKAILEGNKVVLLAAIPAGVTVPNDGLYLYPSKRDVVADGKAAQAFEVDGDTLKITIDKSGGDLAGVFSGRLVSETGFGDSAQKSVFITVNSEATDQAKQPSTDAPMTLPAAEEKPAGLSLDDLTEKDKKEIRAANKEIASWFKQERRPILLMILFAFVGGIILNLMPCVFPVLGIKIMGFVSQAGEEKEKIRKHGLVFASGVILSLWALVTVLLLLKKFGEEVGWGFQLQDPIFLAVMILVLFAFGLNLSGLFEIGTSLTSAGSDLQHKHGYSGSFFSGVLAVLVATPCTGPFMGPAIGFALTGSALETYSIFTALAIGLALPYVILSFFPALIQKLPKPGPWMETFKQFMAFPLYATVIWLIGVFGKVTGLGAVSYLLFGLVTLAMGLWIYGRFGTPFKPAGTKFSARFAAIALAGGAAWLAFSATSMKVDSKEFGAVEDKYGIAWQGYDPRKIVEARNNGRSVFIDFTADW